MWAQEPALMAAESRNDKTMYSVLLGEQHSVNEPIRKTYEAEMKEVFSLNAVDSPKHEGNWRFLFCVSIPDTLPAFFKPGTGGLGNALYFCLMRIEKRERRGSCI